MSLWKNSVYCLNRTRHAPAARPGCPALPNGYPASSKNYAEVNAEASGDNSPEANKLENSGFEIAICDIKFRPGWAKNG
jgi:hypothetical protein